MRADWKEPMESVSLMAPGQGQGIPLGRGDNA